MRHRYECPTRWADLDLLGHVNNVVYVDYLQEARVAALREHTTGTVRAGEGLVVARHRISYRRPLLFDFRPVSIESWVTDVRAASFTMAYEVFHDRDPARGGGRTVFLRAESVLAPYVFGTEAPRRLDAAERAALAPLRDDEPALARPGGPTPRRVPDGARAHRFPVHVRFSDLDPYGHVNNVTYIEYLQEARLALLHELWSSQGAAAPSLVVAQTDVDYRRPLLLRPEPYVARSWIARVGRTSADVDSVIEDDRGVVAAARVTIVFVDPDTGAAQPPAPEHRQALESAALAV